MSAVKRRTAIKWLLLALSSACVVALIAWAWPRERRLLKVAHQQVQMTDADYFTWLSDRELLLYRSVSLPSGEEWRLSRYDMTTHQETPLQALSTIFNQYHGYPEAGQVSPDGKRLLWAGNISKRQKNIPAEAFRAVSATLEGKQLVISKLGSWLATDALVSNTIRWMPDGQHWAEFDSGRFYVVQKGDPSPYRFNLNIHSLNSPQTKQTLTLSSKGPTSELNDMYVTPDRLLAAEEPFMLARNRPPMQIKEFSLRPPVALRQTYQMRLPAEMLDAEDHFVWTFSLKPKDNTLAYVVDYTHRDAWRQKWSRLFPFLSVPVQEVSGLWVSQLDGTKAHEIGYVILKPNVEDNPTFRHLQWSPDGRRLGFLYDGRVYVVEVE